MEVVKDNNPSVIMKTISLENSSGGRKGLLLLKITTPRECSLLYLSENSPGTFIYFNLLTFWFL